MKKALKFILVLILIPALWVGGNLLYGTLTDFQPPVEEAVLIDAVRAQRPDSIITLLNWNIGYCGLGEESDFFYDGGSTVRMDQSFVQKNLNGVINTLKYYEEVDIILLQEVDTFSKRSWKLNEYKDIAQILQGHNASFCLNYNVNFVPIPFLDPMGKVMGGLATYNRFTVTNATRHQFPSSFAWPNSIYFLDRCFMVQRMPYNDVELVVINTHNSAYDDDGTLKKAELAHLKEFLSAEEKKGNYVIVGGDWNQHAPGSGDNEVPSDYLAGWQWVYDTSFPTNRDLKAAYVKGETMTQVIDFFLCSPNISVEEVKVINQDFKFSDHQPVYLRVKLKG
jgi:endonuclease/exonuclease/phosphatase family metal-dependent hydrolase